ncbi:MAG TPA: hypothetical protein VNO30_44580 [Kofleriaceae bacterium]|nr:hypothetical protein [Kofleriaceae bacterium]
MRYLRDVMAGPGAGRRALDTAAVQVKDFLLKKISAEIQLLSPRQHPSLPIVDLPLPVEIDRLRYLMLGQGLLDGAALEKATLKIEQMLVRALKAEATKLLTGSVK